MPGFLYIICPNKSCAKATVIINDEDKEGQAQSLCGFCGKQFIYYYIGDTLVAKEITYDKPAE